MLIPNINKYWVALVATIVLIVGLVGLGWYGYTWAYNHGVRDTKLECMLANDQYQQQVREKLDSMEQSLQELAKTNKKQQQQLKDDMRGFAAALNKEPTVVVVNGECKPSDNAVKVLQDAIDRANK